MKLSIELVPSTTWCNNLRSILSKEDWDLLRKESYRLAKYKCEICGGKGDKHPVECHERWVYNDKKHIQKLEGLISLCPSCHQVKHIGFAYIKGNGEKAKKHFMKVNNYSQIDATKYINKAFQKHEERSQYEWDIDLTFLKDRNISLNV